MTSPLAVQKELARFREVSFAALVGALDGAESFYGEDNLFPPQAEEERDAA
ncbi:MAG: hypothetical protein Q7R73_03115 [bacterium]|nr:hypothetical protein [bacterium]